MLCKPLQSTTIQIEYFLSYLTGGRIDHAHHANAARVALEETLAFEQAVTRTLELVDLEDTLVIVTADHSHPLSIGSYSTRGNPILGEKLLGEDINIQSSRQFITNLA